MTLDEEKLKVMYEHRLQVWRIVIEKGLLGILLGLAVLAANMLIEDFKSDLSRQRFMLESRLTALQDLRESYSLLSNHLWHLAREDKATSEKRLLPAYGKDVDKFIQLANKWSPLFSASFNKAIEQHVYTHTAVSQGNVKVTREHWHFLSDVFDDFDHVTRAALWEETLGVRSPVEGRRFELEAWSFDDVNNKGTKAFFDANFDKWQRRKPTAK